MIDKVYIFGIPHTVEYKSDTFRSGDTHFGEIDFAKCEIIINKDMPEESQRETLIHEMVHGMLVHMGYDDLNNDEKFVQQMAVAIGMSFDIKGES